MNLSRETLLPPLLKTKQKPQLDDLEMLDSNAKYSVTTRNNTIIHSPKQDSLISDNPSIPNFKKRKPVLRTKHPSLPILGN